MKGKSEAVARIMDLWMYDEKTWLKFKEIEERTGIPERSLARYLNAMVKKEVLEKGEKGYRPYYASFDEALLASIKWGQLRKRRMAFMTEDQVLAIARPMFKAHLTNAATEILRNTERVLTSRQEPAEITGETTRLWIDLFIADFYQQLRKLSRHARELHFAERQGKAINSYNDLKKVARSIAYILRSYANLTLRLYKHRSLTWHEVDKIVDERLADPSATSQKILNNLKKEQEKMIARGLPRIMVEDAYKDIIFIRRIEWKIEAT